MECKRKTSMEKIYKTIEDISKTRSLFELKLIYQKLNEKHQLFEKYFPYNTTPLQSPRLERRNAISSEKHLFISLIEELLLKLIKKQTRLIDDYNRTTCIKQILNITNIDDIICNYLNLYSLNINHKIKELFLDLEYESWLRVDQ